MPTSSHQRRAAQRIEPAANNVIERVTECCMDVNVKSAYIAKGRSGMAWWLIWGTMMCAVLVAGVAVFGGEPLAALSGGVPFLLIAASGFGATLYIWPLRVWRTHLPLRFNRKNRKVYFHWKGETYIEDWDTLQIQFKEQFVFSPIAPPSGEPQINVRFHDRTGKPFDVLIVTELHHLPLTKVEQAAALAEYIRCYMDEGPEHLPPVHRNRFEADLKLAEIVKEFRLPKLWRRDHSFTTNVLNLFTLPVVILWDLITCPTEIIFYYLTRNIRTDPFPPEMEAPCRCDGEPAQHGSE